MSQKPKPSGPKWTSPPYTNGTSQEIPSGVFHIRTGRTRRMVKWGAVIGALTALATPIVNALAARIAPHPETKIERELRELRDLLGRDAGP